MLSIANGHDVGYLTGPVAGGREGYYTGAVAAGEPAGLWYGAGAEALGLTGEVDADLMEAVYANLLDPRDPATHSRSTWGEAETLAAGHRTYRSADEVYAGLLESNPGAGPERRDELRAQAERSARQAVAFIDATFSAPKSVTVLGVAFERAANDALAAGDEQAAQAWAAHQRAVEDAVMAGARAALDYLQNAAGYSRVGHHGGGAGRWIDAHSFVVAQFLQHDSRDRDPQLHVHQAILNRVRCADGTWRALDGRAIRDHRGAAGAIGERVMEAHLSRVLGLRFATRADGHGREVVGVSQPIMDLFSSRRHAITARAQGLVRAFTDRFGREPSAVERTKLSQQATLATRAAKAHNGETLDQRLDRWEAESRAVVTGGLSEVARTVLNFEQHAPAADTWSVDDVVERALATIAEVKQAWTRPDLLRAVSDALPGHLLIDPDQALPLLEGLTDLALVRAVQLNPDTDTTNLPAQLQLADGRSVYSRPGAARFTAPHQLTAERMLRAAAVTRGAAAVSAEEAAAAIARFAESGRELGVDQAAAMRGVLTSGAQVEVMAAAAGTGKSFVVGAIADTWTAAGHRVIGLAPSQVAAQVLVDEGLNAWNVARWLAAQDRAGNGPGGDDEPMRLHPDDLLVVDEAGMTSTTDLAKIQQHCAAVGAKLLLVGDPRQLAAVGPGGALADIAEHGLRYDLAEVRRFTADWEREASLQLRAGDPTALEAYSRHGRLVDCGAAEQTEAAAARAWLADTLAGRESLLLVGTNAAAARLSAELRAQLVELGRVDERGVELAAQGTVAGAGDLVQARRNGWDLIGQDGNTRAPINRETYTVTAIADHGGLTVVDAAGNTLTLPPAYVAENLALGYASTVHAAQGRTVDTAHTVIGPGSDAAGVYVGLTRGRDANTAYVITAAVPTDAATGEVLDAAPRTARAVIADLIEGAEHERTALAEQEQAAAEARSALLHLGQLADGVAQATAGRTAEILDRLAAAGALTDDERTALAADQSLDALDRLLRAAELAGHDPARVLSDAVAERDLDDARAPAQVLHHRIRTSLEGQLTPRIDGCADLLPRDLPEQWRDWLQERADAADERRRELGAETAEQAPQWALEALGPVPEDALARAEWELRAGWAAGYRELAGHTDESDPLGVAPGAGIPEKWAVWRTAHAALDLPDAGADEAELSDGDLRVRVRAYEREETWAPDWVADELAATYQAAERNRADAEVWTARANTATDPAEQEQLRGEAERARQDAEDLATRAAELEAADLARGFWYAHTAITRNNAERARVELANRGIDLDAADEQVTADEWLAAQAAADAEDDRHREIGERDMHDGLERPTDDGRVDGVETAVPDIRDTSVPSEQETTALAASRRVPTVDETAATIARAQEALAQIQTRQQVDALREAEDAAEQGRYEELARWAADDRAAEEQHTAELSPEALLER
jgi:conjugative relaxase-like TrwC/TraI family protein